MHSCTQSFIVFVTVNFNYLQLSNTGRSPVADLEIARVGFTPRNSGLKVNYLNIETLFYTAVDTVKYLSQPQYMHSVPNKVVWLTNNTVMWSQRGVHLHPLNPPRSTTNLSTDTLGNFRYLTPRYAINQ